MAQLEQPEVLAEAPTPVLGQHVRVHGCNQRRCSAQVVQIAARMIELRLTEEEPDQLAVRELVDAPTVVLEFFADEAMHRIYAKAHLQWSADGASLFLMTRGGSQLLGRRKYLRTELEAIAILQSPALEERIEGWIVNMSVGGMLVDRMSLPLPLGGFYDFTIVPSGNATSITGTASVVRVESPRRAACQIVELATPSEDELVRILFEDSEIRRAAR